MIFLFWARFISAKSLSLDQSASSQTRMFSILTSLSPANFKRHKKPFYSPHLPYFLKVQLRKCMEPIGNLANVEELDLKTGQQTGKMFTLQ